MKTIPRKPKTPHDHQLRDIKIIFDTLSTIQPDYRLLYQLPTGGGKTLVFSEIAKKFIEVFNGQVFILTHRSELCRQTASILRQMGIETGTLTSRETKQKHNSDCTVAMVETLRNRIRERKINIDKVRLVIIDEAHHNSFRKLLGNFKNAFVIGVTATPFSSDIAVPMNKTYKQLIAGENIQSLIDSGFLAKPKAHVYEVELNTLKKGIHGDYTVASSNELYSTPAMLNLLLKAYNENAKGKKTLIFNNGIETSIKVYEAFNDAGIPIRHLDNKTPDDKRKEILGWFRKTKGAVLTSVSILTTGFDEPSVQTVILNRATTSITLYHQMIGRGSRILPSKRTFTIIDLGNNIQRFGEWEQPLDWEAIFKNPEAFAEQLNYAGTGSAFESHALSAEIRSRFPNTLELTFDVESHYEDIIAHGLKPKRVIQQSLRQQALMCIDNASSVSEALELAELLSPEIEWRTNQYVKCIEKATKSYKQWLTDDYKQRLHKFIVKLYYLKESRELAQTKSA